MLSSGISRFNCIHGKLHIMIISGEFFFCSSLLVKSYISAPEYVAILPSSCKATEIFTGKDRWS